MANPVVHFEIQGQDQAKLREFYGRLFGWELETMPETPEGEGMTYTMARAVSNGRGIDGGIGPSQGGNGLVTFYVEVPDPGAHLKRIEELGGRTVVPETEMGMVTIALFSDPEGHVIGLVKSQ